MSASSPEPPALAEEEAMAVAVGDEEEEEGDAAPPTEEVPDDDAGAAEDDEEEEEIAMTQQDRERRAANIAAVLKGTLETTRAPLCSRYLSVQAGEAVLRRQFKCPKTGAQAGPSKELARRLAVSRRFVPWGSSEAFRRPRLALPVPGGGADGEEAEAEVGVRPVAAAAAAAGAAEAAELPPGVEPLVLWGPAAAGGDEAGHQQQDAPVVVDPILTRWLRPHQREGVRFMFQCLTGQRVGGRGGGGDEEDGDGDEKDDDEPRAFGCILADDMGLGKTLQSIAVLWTLLRSSAPRALRRLEEEEGGEGEGERPGATAEPAKPAPAKTPFVRRVVIVCPVSLVGNWESELRKWLLGRAKVLALSDVSKDEAGRLMRAFVSGGGGGNGGAATGGPAGGPLAYRHAQTATNPPNNKKPSPAALLATASSAEVLIASYETFRAHAPRLFKKPGAVDLLIADEAHRLRNPETATYRALASLPCRKRVMLSGTPIQNRLGEFFAMCDFACPGVLGSPAHFRRWFEAPILAGREPGADSEERSEAAERSRELSGSVDRFILRRTNALLSDHLPPKVVSVVVCALSPLQEAIYARFLESTAAARALLVAAREGSGGDAGVAASRSSVLAAIVALQKLANHPRLLVEAAVGAAAAAAAGGKRGGGGGGGGGGIGADFLAVIADLLPPELTPACLGGRMGATAAMGIGRRGAAIGGGWGGGGGGGGGLPAYSGKMALLSALLDATTTSTTTGISQNSGDRWVIVSNYTTTLDLVAEMCASKHLRCVRLDGSISVSKRTALVSAFNDRSNGHHCFLLSSKAGGCGLNLVGANRLLLFDSSWNPADDKQAAGRVWRDGQRRRVYVYRFVSRGTLEERIFCRQLAKEGLRAAVEKQEDGAEEEFGGGAMGLGGEEDEDDGGGGGGGGAAAPGSLLSAAELKELFTYASGTRSTTHDALRRAEEGGGGKGGESEEEGGDDAAAAAPPLALADDYYRPQRPGAPREDDLPAWARHAPGAMATVPDAVLQKAAEATGAVTFVFSLSVQGREDILEGGAAVGGAGVPVNKTVAAAAAPAAPPPPAGTLLRAGPPPPPPLLPRRPLVAAAAALPLPQRQQPLQPPLGTATGNARALTAVAAARQQLTGPARGGAVGPRGVAAAAAATAKPAPARKPARRRAESSEEEEDDAETTSSGEEEEEPTASSSSGSVGGSEEGGEEEDGGSVGSTGAAAAAAAAAAPAPPASRKRQAPAATGAILLSPAAVPPAAARARRDDPFVLPDTSDEEDD